MSFEKLIHKKFGDNVNFGSVMEELFKLQETVEIEVKYEGYLSTFKCQHTITSMFSVGMHGKLASHTGYNSKFLNRDVDAESVYDAFFKITKCHYEKYINNKFIVYEEHRVDGGWKPFYSYKDVIVSKFPHWIENDLVNQLKEIGYTNKNNHFYGEFVIKSSLYNKKELQLILKPLLEPGSRFKDQSILTKEVKSSYEDFLAEYRKPSLFDSLDPLNEIKTKASSLVKSKVEKAETQDKLQMALF